MTYPNPAIRLLIAEDNHDAREVLGLIIAKKLPDAAIFFAENGRKGVELFKEHAVDIVVTDINMPDMDGIQMAREIKALKSDTKFILLSGHCDHKYLKEFNSIGIQYCISKPLEFNKFFSAVDKCIAEINMKRQSDALCCHLH